MLVTFSVVDMPSVFVFNRKLTFAKDNLTLNEFLSYIKECFSQHYHGN